jgi:hypothetical protein
LLELPGITLAASASVANDIRLRRAYYFDRPRFVRLLFHKGGLTRVMHLHASPEPETACEALDVMPLSALVQIIHGDGMAHRHIGHRRFT